MHQHDPGDPLTRRPYIFPVLRACLRIFASQVIYERTYHLFCVRVQYAHAMHTVWCPFSAAKKTKGANMTAFN